jgi:anionic cell wall polymer biosynthesis LytR-Cps2A-Psr (LCP) family protein
MLKAMGKNVETNMNADAMKVLVKNYRQTRANMINYEVAGTGGKIDGIYYLLVSDEEKAKVKALLSE